MDNFNIGRAMMDYDYRAGSLIVMSPDKAREHDEKLRLCDMKNSKYRVMVSFNEPKKAVKVARKNSDKK